MITNLKECFFQIGILPEQRDLFHIFWFVDDDIEKAIETWHFTVHVWEVASSLMIATRCIHQVAKENRKHTSPLTISSLTCNMYVDALLKSLDTIEDMHTLYR